MTFEQSDEHLVQRMAERDKSALLEFHNRYAHRLVAFIKRVLDDPDEVMQSALDTFAYAWNHAEHYDPDKLSAKAWLLTIAQRTALNRRRGSDNEIMPLQSWNVPTKPLDAAENSGENAVENVAEHPPAAADLDAKVSAEARDYLELAFYRGYSLRQVSEETGTPLSTVRAEMHQALQKLRAERTGDDL